MTVKYLASKKDYQCRREGKFATGELGYVKDSHRGEMQFVIIYYLVSSFMGRMQGTVSSVLAYSLTLYSRMTGDMDKTEQNL